jgi:hypothetical protein
MPSAVAFAPAIHEIPREMTYCDGVSVALNDDLRNSFAVKKVKCLYENSDPKVFWLVQGINQREEVFAKYMFADEDAPLFARQLLAITHCCAGHGTHMSLTYVKYCICKGCHARDFADVKLLHEESAPANALCVQDADRPLFSQAIALLHKPLTKTSRVVFMAALHWRNFVKNNVARRLAQARAHARTDLLREELIAAAWHPRRFADWCLDCDERAELAEFFAKK